MPASTSPAHGRSDGGAPGAPAPQGAVGKALFALLGTLKDDPSALPALGAVALLIAWAANQAGYPQTHWAPGGIILLALLVIAVGATGLRVTSIPWPVRIAIAALAAYTAWSFLSILWANVPGDAWEGADRTLVYLIVFALFASFGRTGASAALLLCVWTLAMAGLAVYTVLRVDAASGSAAAVQQLMPEGRLTAPAGYVNANAALWMMAFYPAWLMAGSRRLPALLRGLLAGGAAVLAAVALYSQSRGAVYSIPIMLVLIFALFPGRVRNLITLIPIGLGVGACVPAVLHLAKGLESGGSAASAAHSATLSVLLAALVVTVVSTLLATLEARWPAALAVRARTRRGVGLAAGIAALVLVVSALVAVGRPVGRVEHAWNTFTSLKGYAANASGQSRLTGGFGSNRYDFYRVAWHEFLAHPLTGIGADNFAEQYLRSGHSQETPRYPHSVEMRTLAETGLIGALIALCGLIGSLIASSRALRRTDPLAKAVAAAAVAGFAYWAIHGSFDWFFEYAGLGAAAFALLGLSCSLCRGKVTERSRQDSRGSQPRDGRVLVRIGTIALGAALIGAAVVSLALPWLSRMEVQSAARTWPTATASAYADLDEAAALNPLSDEPYLVAGSIALRRNELRRADREFELALRRTPGDVYATLERGTIASTVGQRGAALVLLARASRLAPRDGLITQALAIARRGKRVSVRRLNQLILHEAQQFP
jgi:O-antigen ligase